FWVIFAPEPSADHLTLIPARKDIEADIDEPIIGDKPFTLCEERLPNLFTRPRIEPVNDNKIERARWCIKGTQVNAPERNILQRHPFDDARSVLNLFCSEIDPNKLGIRKNFRLWNDIVPRRTRHFEHPAPLRSRRVETEKPADRCKPANVPL